MDHTRGLIAVESEPVSRSSDCPDCGAPRADLPPVGVSSLGGSSLARCHRCGRRHTRGTSPREIRICPACRLPAIGPVTDEGPCESCAAERALASVDPRLVAATEGEVKAALAASWRLVGSPRTTEYLTRLAREIATVLDGVGEGARVVLAAETSVRALALPSGTVLLSVGALEAVEDEAELAFVLAHELAHVASGDVATALVRMSLRGVAVEGQATDATWVGAAEDLIRLGYGDSREHAADRTALQAVAARDYDPQAAMRYLRRLRRRTDRGDPDVAELALAHPPPAQRLLRLEREAGLRLRETAEVRVDREVFRRAAGHSVLSTELAPVRPFDDETSARPIAGGVLGSRWFWMLAGLAVIVLVVVLAVV